MDNKNKEGNDHNTQNSNDTKKKKKKTQINKEIPYWWSISLQLLFWGSEVWYVKLNNLAYRFEATRIAAFTFEKTSDIGKRYSTRFLYTPTRSFQKQPPIHTHTHTPQGAKNSIFRWVNRTVVALLYISNIINRWNRWYLRSRSCRKIKTS